MKAKENLRYAGNAVGWWLHDCLVHPITGTLGLIGRATGSLRLMAFAHHFHNATAPSNDAAEDYVLAARRAGTNEYGGRESFRPDELWAINEQAEAMYGDEAWKMSEAERFAAVRGTPAGRWKQQTDPHGKPEIIPKDQIDPAQLNARFMLDEAEAALRKFLRQSAAEALGVGEHYARQIKNLADAPERDALRRELAQLTARVERARAAFAKAKRPVTVDDIIGGEGT